MSTGEPSTGKVRVMVSIPEYDPNQVPTGFRQIERDPNQPLLNRTTQELYPPGSTFKVVTAAAALDTGRYTPSSRFDDPGYFVRSFRRAHGATPLGWRRAGRP